MLTGFSLNTLVQMVGFIGQPGRVPVLIFAYARDPPFFRKASAEIPQRWGIHALLSGQALFYDPDPKKSASRPARNRPALRGGVTAPAQKSAGAFSCPFFNPSALPWPWAFCRSLIR